MTIADLLAGLARANLAAAAAVVVVLLLRGRARKLFGARAAYGLWALPLLAAVAVLVPHPQIVTPIAPLVLSASVATEEFVASAPAAARSAGPDLISLLFGAWIAGAVLMAGLLLRRQVAFVGSLGRLERVSGRLFKAERSGVGPAVVGVIRPRIVAPADFETLYGAAERDLILAHETAHLKAGDAAVNALLCAAQCLGWFNPAAHVAAKLLRVDQELACDAAVIGTFPAQRKIYAELLLKTQLFTQPLPLGCHWPAGAEHPLKERIAMLKSPLPAPSRRAIGLACVAALSLTGAAAAWAAQPGAPGATASPTAAIPNNGHLEPAEARALWKPGLAVLCKPDENRELHNCKILGSGFAVIATAADVQREWPAAAKKAGLTGWVTLQCTANNTRGRLEACSGYHYGGAAERPELKAAFEQAAIRVISVIRLKTNPGPDDHVMDESSPKFFTIEFNDHPNMPGGPPANPPVTRYPDFLPGPPPKAADAAKPVAATVAAQPAAVITSPDWAQKPTAQDVARAYPAADQDELGGTAVIDCRFTGDGRLAGCGVKSELPPEDGFGAAALKLAPLFRAKPMSRDGVAVAGGFVRIPIRFQGPHRGPDLPLDGAATVTRPVWTEKPTAADIARLYPPEALKQGLSADVVLNCRVGADGRFAECGVAPPNDLPMPIAMDFGSATLQLAKLFRMQPQSADGAATAGGLIHIPVRWAPPSRPSAAALVTQPVWIEKPTLAELVRVYPPEAVKQNLEGMTTLSCAVDRDGRLNACTATGVSTFGAPDAIREDFRKATLKLAGLFRLQTQPAGGRVIIPIRWALPTDRAAKARLDALTG